ncbi:MAG: hypothetical protein CMM57_03880 [Rhodospirillaceae bacterium]|nr:hypothetical protein [Rhodospirillaceae bacterium]
MANKNRNTLFRFSVIADTHIIENDAPAIDGYDPETVQLSVKRLAGIDKSRFSCNTENRYP